MESLLVYLGDGDTIKENAALLSGKECWSLSGLQVIGAVFGASFGGGEGVFIRRRSTDADRDYGK